MSIPRIAELGVIGGLAAVGAAPAHGQVPQAGSGLDPIRCYLEATRTSTLEHHKAKHLCIGAPSVAPARCYAEAVARANLTDDDAVRLCRVASSTAPAECADRLRDTTTLATQTIVDYCTALRWTLVYSGTGGVPECLEAARARTTLSDQQAAQLCAGSESTAPVACYQLGEDKTTLTDNDLVGLCTTVVIVPYSLYRP